MEVKKIEKCRICGNTKLVTVLDLGTQTLSGRFPGKDEPDPPKAPLELVKCMEGCGLVQLQHTVESGELYTNSYGYRSGLNQTMVMHFKDMAKQIQKIVELCEGDVVLDIGSNDATLLKSYDVKGLWKVGIDPLGTKYSEYYTEDIELISDYFNATLISDKKPKVITSVAMFYDLEKPMDFVADIKKILHPKGVWVLEQSYMPTMLKMNSFDTICHEHLEYYSLKQINWMLNKNNLRIIDVEFNDINGGSFRVYACHKEASYKTKEEKIRKVLRGEERFDSLQPFEEFKENVFRLRRELCWFLKFEKSQGKSIYVYGASTKGNVLLQFYGIDHGLISAAAERNSEKWGSRTPGTNIPIVSEEEARKAKPNYFLVLPWHFKSEFIDREEEFLNSGGKLIFPLPRIETIYKKVSE